MALLDRVATLVRANINDLIERAEDPEKVVKQLLLDMNNQHIQVRAQVATAMADERRLQRLAGQNEARAQEWDDRARKAVASGKDDVARECLSRAMTYEEIAAAFRKQHETQATQVRHLREAFQQLDAKVESLQARKDLLIARSRQARALASLQQTASRTNDVSALVKFRRIEERVEEEEAKAEALVDLDRETLAAQLQQGEEEEELQRRLELIKAGEPAGSKDIPAPRG